MYDPLNSNINETNESTEPLKNEKNNEAVNNASGETESFQQDYRSMNEQGAAENTAAFEPEAPGTGEQAAAQEPQGTADAQSWPPAGPAAQPAYGGSYYTNGGTAYNGNAYTVNQQTNQQAGQPSSQYQWSGSAYHYARPAQAPGPQNQQQKPPKPPRKKGRGGKLALKIVACVLACLVVSGASVGGVLALANAGYITIGGASSGMDINGKADSSAAGDGKEDSGSSGNIVNHSANTQGSGLTMQEVAAKVIPSVVCIQNYQNTTNYIGAGTQQTRQDSEVSPSSEGSGIIATSDGYIITNAHVVSGADTIKVITSDGTTYEAELIGSDEVTDLAVIKINATGLTAAEFGSSEELQIADQVMAVGNPGGLELNSSVTIGYISALNRPITTSSGYTMNCIQTDAAINPGNSGGALVNSRGQVVGINSSKIVATGYEGLGFSIPIDEAEPVINSLKQYGYVKDRAMLGISGQYLDAMSARMYGLTQGMYVAEVTNESVRKAGISQGCVITKIDDTEVTSQATITNYVSTKKPGDEVTLEVYNGLTGKTFTATVTLSESSGD
ncbi:Periplasmic serine endoprotease DegP precursor [uncultured Ruminococcus sp.]|nr:Periplasmic serine endoprotease DegP precursor [uncultured Ruminococcus sp.]